jgi:hypothetical protein
MSSPRSSATLGNIVVSVETFHVFMGQGSQESGMGCMLPMLPMLLGKVQMPIYLQLGFSIIEIVEDNSKAHFVGITVKPFANVTCT